MRKIAGPLPICRMANHHLKSNTLTTKTLCCYQTANPPTNLTANNTGRPEDNHEKTVRGWFTLDSDPSVPKNAWGMELYPRSVYDLLMDLREKYIGYEPQEF